MNTEITWIAERELQLQKPSGENLSITLRIGQPYKADSGEWRCPVALDGLVPNLPHIAGVDSWQAIQLAQRLQAQLLTSLLKEGELLFYGSPASSQVPVTVPELFQTLTQL